MPRKRNPNTPPSPARVRLDALKAIQEHYSGEDTAHVLFRRAVELDTEKRALLAKIGANRRSLRDLAAQDIVNVQDVDAIYPPKTTNDETAPDEIPAAA